MKFIDIIAPASRISQEDVLKTKSFLAEKGYKYSFPKFSKDLICSASKEKREADFKKALKSKTSDFIWCLRGGYGSHHLIASLGRKDFLKPKVLMGFSDITSLHYYFNEVLSWPSVHGPHANSFIKDHSKRVLKESLNFVERADEQSPVFENLRRLNEVKKTNIKAKIVGGNLVTLASVIGTKYDRGTKGRILFLEEIQEPAYKINRILEHMKQAQFLNGVKAVVFGSFTHEDKNELKKVNQYLKEWAKEQKFPVISGMSAGHIKENRPFWLGKKSLLILDRSLDQKVSLHNNI